MKSHNPDFYPTPKAAFNRTLLELKYCNQLFGLTKIYTFNRTLLELKSDEMACKTVRNRAFNRTLLELKCQESQLIFSIKSTLQSHLTGIEIMVNLIGAFRQEAFNRTLLELKFCLLNSETIRNPPSIAPYWN